MSISTGIAAQLKRHRPNESFPPVAAEDGLIFLEDTEKRSYLGACFIGKPLSGAGDQTMEKLKSVLSGNFPPDTYVQIQLLSVPDIDLDVYRYLQPKLESCRNSPVVADGQRSILREAAERRAQFFIDGKKHPHIQSNGVRNHRVIQVISIKVPTAARPTEREVEEANEILAKFEQGLITTGFPLKRASAGEYLSILRMITNPWAAQDFNYDDEQEIREQIFPPGYSIDYSHSRQLDLNGTKARILSVSRYPKTAHIGLMNLVAGDPSGINNQFPVPWLVSLSIHFPERNKKKNWFKSKHGVITLQSRGSMAHFIPRIGLKKAAFDAMAADLENGDPLVEMCFNITLFSEDDRELAKLSSQMTTFMSGYGLELVEDQEILWPLLWNTLPLFPSDSSTANLFRYSSMQLRAAMQFSPILCDWTGTGNAAMLFETRRGEPFAYDLYDSTTNYNALVFAEAGGGKGVLINTMITDYLALGARVWVVDIGRTYYKLSKLLGGEFISFGENSDLCINPFTFVRDIDDELGMLTSLLAKMAAPANGLDDYRMARLQESIKAVWGSKGHSMSVTDVAEYLDMQDDQRIKDISNMLFPFTRPGQYGHWFDGESNLQFHSNFIVLELEELGQKEHLQQVVLMILMSKIQHEMFEVGDGIKKFAIFDEAWALLSDPGVALFLNHGYRRFRKYNGSAIMALQSIADLYMHPSMKAVIENSATRFILKQQPESIDSVVDSGKLALDDYGRSQLKSVHTIPGQYSELMIHTGTAYSITRLAHPRFTQVLYSTTGDERDRIIQAIENGVPAEDAINDYIEQRG